MAYLVSHIAICLIFAQLLGLLLGWLLWGYAARQRGKEVQTLRERLADMHFMSAARATMAAEPRLALQEGPDAFSGPLQSAFSSVELPERPSARRAFFEEAAEGEPEVVRPILSEAPVSASSINTPAISPPPISPDLEAEVREAKIQHLQQQVRELEGFRDRLPLLQADLSDAIAGRRAAEARFQEAKNDFEVRSSSLLLQIRDFEAAAGEWDRQRAEFEREKLLQQKELEGVKATLRDLQNSQRPQSVHAPDPELAELRERCQRLARERETLAAEAAFWKQSAPAGAGNSARMAELEEALRGRDAQLSEQAARLESLLWRVAELEPFAAEAPQKDEVLRRQESEIAGHVAMHAENASQLRLLREQLEELQATTIPGDELKKIMAEHQAAMQGLVLDHQQRVSELEHAIFMKEEEMAEHVAARHEQADQLNGLQARVAELEAAAGRAAALEESLAERESEHRAEVQRLLRDREEQLAAVRSDLQQAHAAALEAAGQRIEELEQALAGRENEHREQLAALQNELLGSHMESLDIASQRINALEKSLSDRDIEIRALLSVHSDTQREMEGTRRELEALRVEAERQRGENAQWQERMAELEATLSRQSAELQQQKELNHDKDGQLTFLHERLGSVSSRLAAHQQRLLQLEPLAARAPEMEQQLKTLETKHHHELTRLKVNSAQRIRRFRQSINTLKT